MGVAIRRAGQDDREAVTGLLDEAFFPDQVSSWVFPDEADRRRAHAGLMGAFVDAALAEGHVDMAEDGTAVALWLSVPAGHAPDPDGPAQFREAIDPGNERVEQITRILDEAHPKDRAHEYLMMIGVSAERRSQGVGTELMNPVLARCDREGLSAYLEASSERSRALYERLGFTYLGRTIDLPDGPHMWPMWRDPQPGSAL
ncbi:MULTISPECIES: GNAT family N-acetyltransferase [unclassified Streptomyces]|uniref:GNAT family N-acetyltransferase n=1 Tax=unclassified Streptomyces TaxID=2593676 RepID=UPI002E2866E6|nr:GNAT family N-acetyltransferase [Streptomyces sp. NBC_00223]